uniref:Uncharacterized protein n=1 Tax=Odontella aurita TaxID=265563 RepID=A0A7S4MH36_9STRA
MVVDSRDSVDASAASSSGGIRSSPSVPPDAACASFASSATSVGARSAASFEPRRGRRDDAAAGIASSRPFASAFDTFAGMAADLLALGDNHNVDFDGGKGIGADAAAGALRVGDGDGDSADRRGTAQQQQQQQQRRSFVQSDFVGGASCAIGRPQIDKVILEATASANECTNAFAEDGDGSSSAAPAFPPAGNFHSAFNEVPTRRADPPSANAAMGAVADPYGARYGAAAMRRVHPQESGGVGVNPGREREEEAMTPLARLRHIRSQGDGARGIDATAAATAASAATSSPEERALSDKQHRWRERQRQMAKKEQEQQEEAASVNSGSSASGGCGDNVSGTACFLQNLAGTGVAASLAEAGTSLVSVRNPADVLKGIMSQNCRIDLGDEQGREKNAYDCRPIPPSRSPDHAMRKSDRRAVGSGVGRDHRSNKGNRRLSRPRREGSHRTNDEDNRAYESGSDDVTSGEDGDVDDESDDDDRQYLVHPPSTDEESSNSGFPKPERGRSRPKYDGTVYTNAVTRRREGEELRQRREQERVREEADGELKGIDDAANGGPRSIATETEATSTAKGMDVLTKGTPRKVASPLVDIKKFVKQIATEGVPLTWHRVRGGSDMVIAPTLVLAFVQLEEADEDVDSGATYSEPRLVWNGAENVAFPEDEEDDEFGQGRDVRGSIGMFDIASVERVQPSDPASGHLRSSAESYGDFGGGFLITLNGGGSLLFEARDGTERTRVINGLRHMIARMAFNVVIGNSEVCSELLDFGEEDDEEIDEQEEINQAMKDVTNHLVDKAALKISMAAQQIS